MFLFSSFGSVSYRHTNSQTGTYTGRQTGRLAHRATKTQMETTRKVDKEVSLVKQDATPANG